MILREFHRGVETNVQASITELERAMAERVSSCRFIHCKAALLGETRDELHCGCQVAMLQADLESQKAVQKPVSSSRESEDHDVPKSKPSVYQSINFNQAIYHSIYLCIFSGIALCAPSFFSALTHTHTQVSLAVSLASFGDTLAFRLKAFAQKD